MFHDIRLLLCIYKEETHTVVYGASISADPPTREPHSQGGVHAPGNGGIFRRGSSWEKDMLHGIRLLFCTFKEGTVIRGDIVAGEKNLLLVAGSCGKKG